MFYSAWVDHGSHIWEEQENWNPRIPVKQPQHPKKQCTSLHVAAFWWEVKKLACSLHEIAARIQNLSTSKMTRKPQFLAYPAWGINFPQRHTRTVYALAVEDRIGIISFISFPAGLVQVHSVSALTRPVQAMRSWLQLPWTFEGLWGIIALFSRNAAACFQPAFILQSSVSRFEVQHNRILHNGLDKSGAVHRKCPFKGTGSGAPTPIFTLQQMEGYLEVEHWRWHYLPRVAFQS